MLIWHALRGNRPDRPVVITLVGAGGKSTLLRRLGEEWMALGLRGLLVTTTRLWRRQFEAFPHPVLAPSLTDARAAVTRVRPGRPVMLAQALLPGEAKVRGIPPAWVDTLVAGNALDAVAVEADGSRERPLKAPVGNEPLVPGSTTLFVTVVGWQGVGKPLTATWVHHPEQFGRLAGISPGVPVDVQAISRVLTHPAGGLKGCPPGVRRVVVVNQVDHQEALAEARQLAQEVLTGSGDHPRRAELDGPPFRGGVIGSPQPRALHQQVFPAASPFDEVILAHLQAPDPVWEVHGRVGAVVLAAGAGTRFGGAKQVVLWRRRPLVHHVLDAVARAEVHQVVVVVGAHAAVVVPVVEAWLANRWPGGPPVQVVVNDRWALGQSTSVRAGLLALGEVSAALFPLADQPRVPPALMDALIQRHRETLAPTVVPRYGGQPGAPVLFDRALFPRLLALTGDTGGRVLVSAYREQVAWVDWPDLTAGWDVDRREDVE